MKFGLLKAFMTVGKDRALSSSAICELQKSRFDELVAYAREKSPFYRSLYQDLGESPVITQLPPVNKRQLMANFDDWVTDPALNREKVARWMTDMRNISHKLDGQWGVYHTSGSTGAPCYVIYDRTADNLATAVSYLRIFNNRWEFLKFLLKGARIFVTLSPGFDYDYCKVADQPLSKLRNKVIDIMTPAPELLRALNRFKPAMIMTYPTVLEVLLPDIRAGNLKIKPVYIITGGEHSNGKLQGELEKHLHCTYLDEYACTECGLLSYECPEGHKHINSDWVIIEPVDENGRLVQDGVQSHKYYLTNLSNFTQPYIRYEVTDRISINRELCPCGSPFPRIIVEGRTDEILEFESKGRMVAVPPMNLQPATLTGGIVQYQLVQKNKQLLEVRLTCETGWEKEAVFGSVKSQLHDYLSAIGIDQVSIVLGDMEPQRNPLTGKFKIVFKE